MVEIPEQLRSKIEVVKNWYTGKLFAEEIIPPVSPRDLEEAIDKRVIDSGSESLLSKEMVYIRKRRELDFERHDAWSDEPFNLVGLALSGGGIRSATFSLGVLQALASRDLLKYFDYLSTVSGGGFIGSSLKWWLSQSEPK